MWDRYAKWYEEDDLKPLKVVGIFVWVVAIVIIIFG
jgi:hypothetical protein